MWSTIRGVEAARHVLSGTAFASECGGGTVQSPKGSGKQESLHAAVLASANRPWLDEPTAV